MISTPADVLSSTARWSVVRGDSLQVLRDLPDCSVDALVTDPPYSSGGAFRGDRMQSTTAKYAVKADCYAYTYNGQLNRYCRTCTIARARAQQAARAAARRASKAVAP